LRFLTLAALAILLYSEGATADCIKPAWKDPVSLRQLTSEERVAFAFAFQTRVHEFVACQRDTLEKRARGLAPADVRQLILRNRAAEERALVEADRIEWCIRLAQHETDPAVVRTKCDGYIESALAERRAPEPPPYRALNDEQRSAYGGVWSYRTLDLGRPGQCMDAPCDNRLGVEVTNMTPVVLRCEVALTISHPDAGTQRGEQVITLIPGDSLPAAQVAMYRAPENIEPEVSCSPAAPFARVTGVPAACALNWVPRAYTPYPRSWTRSSWESGAALVEFAVRRNFDPPEAIRVVQADSPDVGRAAQSLIERMAPSTNCPGQRFGVRVEFRPFPCSACLPESGTVTMYRDDRASP